MMEMDAAEKRFSVFFSALLYSSRTGICTISNKRHLAVSDRSLLINLD